MNYFVYIIYSASIDKFYIGYSADLKERLRKHNTNNKSYTGKTNDWEIVFSEKFASKAKAMAREKQIKYWKSRKRIEVLIQKYQVEHPDF